MTVLIRADRIVAVGRAAEVPVPTGAEVINLTGKHLTPGLCDMHVHSFPSAEISPPLYLANGITTVREMSGTPLLYQWPEQVADGTLLGPRWIVGSQIVDGAPTVGDGEAPTSSRSTPGCRSRSTRR